MNKRRAASAGFAKTVKSKKRTAGLIFLVLAAGLAGAGPVGAPEWRYAVHHQMKILGGILIGDEFGTYWDDRLPEGWVWFKDYEEFARFKKSQFGYLEVEQLFPKLESGRVIFELSKWNFLNIGLNERLEEESVRRFLRIAKAGDLRFRTDARLAELQAEFRNLDQIPAGAKADSIGGSVPLGVNAAAVFILAAPNGQLQKILAEMYGGAVIIGAASLDGNPKIPELGADRFLIRKTSIPWAFDFVGDGSGVLRWNPQTDKESGRFSTGPGAVIILIRATTF